MTRCTPLVLLVLITASVDAFHFTVKFVAAKNSDASTRLSPTQTTRYDFLNAALLTASTILTAPLPCLAKSYSSNARNLDRVNAGDFSGGSVYDNNPSTAGARRRRAMQGCKIPIVREVASEQGALTIISEKNCNIRVVEESPDFILTALQTLECPRCPYGVKASRWIIQPQLRYLETS